MRIAGTTDRASLVREVFGVQVAFGDQEGDEPLLVVCAQRLIEFVLARPPWPAALRCTHQIRLDLPKPHLRAGERPGLCALVVAVRGLGFVQEDLERRRRAPCSSRGRPCGSAGCARDPPFRYCPSSKLHTCRSPPILGVLRSRADGPRDSAYPVAGLENPVVVAELSKLVGGDEARHPGAEHDDLGAVRPPGERRPRPGLGAHQLPRGHRAHHYRRSTDSAEPLEKATPGEHRRWRRSRSKPMSHAPVRSKHRTACTDSQASCIDRVVLACFVSKSARDRRQREELLLRESCRIVGKRAREATGVSVFRATKEEAS